MELATLVNHAIEKKASDIHIKTGHCPVLRILGVLVPLNLPPLTSEEVTAFIKTLLTQEEYDSFIALSEIDCGVEIGGRRYRANIYKTLNGMCIAMRSINTAIPTLGELGVPPIVQRFASLRNGLILITGASGSGKTTTMASIVQYINTHYAKHIITIEDPIEYVHKSDKSLINQRSVGSHTESFQAALGSALRQDPDVIVVGEIRGLDTIRLALTAAETGHLVIGTIHTNSAPKTIDRIIDVFEAGDKPMIRTMLATSLEGIISQILMPTRNKDGLVAGFEILVATNSIRNLIRENKIHQISSIMEISSKQGMLLMTQSIKRLQNEGIISDDTANQYIYSALEIDNPEHSANTIKHSPFDYTQQKNDSAQATYKDSSEF